MPVRVGRWSEKIFKSGSTGMEVCMPHLSSRTDTTTKLDAIGEPKLPPKKAARAPTYRLRRAFGQSVVKVVGRDYLQW